MKKTIVTILSIATILPITVFANIKVTPDKPVEPEFVCKTEADIVTARAQALVKGGGPDFANSAEALCRSQIKASAPVVNNYYYQAPVIQTTQKLDDDTFKSNFCSLHVEGGLYNTQTKKCECPNKYDIMRLKSDNGNGDIYVKCEALKIDIKPIETPATTTEAVAPKQVISKTLKLGDTGDDVKILQKKLGIDQAGVYGPKTKKAVQVFQKENNIPQTGNVGPLTLKKLNEKN